MLIGQVHDKDEDVPALRPQDIYVLKAGVLVEARQRISDLQIRWAALASVVKPCQLVPIDQAGSRPGHAEHVVICDLADSPGRLRRKPYAHAKGRDQHYDHDQYDKRSC